MYIDHRDFGGREPQAPVLGTDAALLLWCLRRLVLAWPRDHAVEAALLRRYGETAVEVGALLRCWLCRLADGRDRPVRFAPPPAARLTLDETLTLAAWELAGRDRAAAAAALAELAGPAEPGLTPLAELIGARLRPDPARQP